MCEESARLLRKFHLAFLVLLAIYSPVGQSQVSKEPCYGHVSTWSDCVGVIENSISEYRGEFKQGEYHGLGVLRYKKEASTYVGEFEKGGRTGVGVEIKLTEGKVQKVSGSWRNGSLLESRELDFLMGGIKAFIFSTTREVEAELKGEARRALERAKSERLRENERIKQQAIADQQRIQREYEQTYGPALEKCKQLGFKKGTDKFADCVLRLSR